MFIEKLFFLSFRSLVIAIFAINSEIVGLQSELMVFTYLYASIKCVYDLLFWLNACGRLATKQPNQSQPSH